MDSSILACLEDDPNTIVSVSTENCLLVAQVVPSIQKQLDLEQIPARYISLHFNETRIDPTQSIAQLLLSRENVTDVLTVRVTLPVAASVAVSAAGPAASSGGTVHSGFYGRFEYKDPGTKLVPGDALDSLELLQSWAREVIGNSANNGQRSMSPDDKINVFLRTRFDLAWKRIHNDAMLQNERGKAQGGKLYFTTAKKSTQFKESISFSEFTLGITPLIVKLCKEIAPDFDKSPQDESEAYKILQEELVRFLQQGNILLVDEIQENPSFAVKLVRALSAPHTQKYPRRMVLLGTPKTRGSTDAMAFRSNTLNKFDSQLVLDPHSPAEFIRLISKTIGPVPAKEIIVLWAMTGGIVRHLRTVLTSVLGKTGRPRSEPWNRDLLVQFLHLRRKQIFSDLTADDWTFLERAANKNTAGVQVSVAAEQHLESIFNKDLLAPMHRNLAPCFGLTDEKKETKYLLNCAFIRSIVRCGTMKSESRADTIVGDVAGFAFEDFVGKMISEASLAGDLWIQDLNLAEYRICPLWFVDRDVDLVLAKKDGESSVAIILGSLKFSQAPFLEMQKTTKMLEMTNFTTANVNLFLSSKIPTGWTVSCCVIVAMTTERFTKADSITSSIEMGFTTLAKKYPTTRFESRLWTLHELLNGVGVGVNSNIEDEVYPTSAEVHDAWPFVHRRAFEDNMDNDLTAGSMCLVRGYGGVGKTTCVQKVAKAVAEELGRKVVYVDVASLVEAE